MDWFVDSFAQAQQWLFESLMQPLMFAAGLGNLLEEGYVGAGWLLAGLLEILILLAVVGPLQRWRPVEPLTDHAGVRTDVLYTLIHRLGLFRVVLFLTLAPAFDQLFGALRVAGLGTWQLDQVWPGVSDQPLASLVIYLIAFDFISYWVHRAQHHFEWWWSLHSLHHSQRQLTMWSDKRNHLLDDVIVDTILVLAAQLIGVAPAQFIALTVFTQLSESLQHANVRIWFGRFGERLWISPRFHRLHHSIGAGHEASPLLARLVDGRSPALGGHNFGVLLPWWDMMFGSANFDLRYDPTGIRDQQESGRCYGRGFWAQQVLGLRRMLGRD